MIIFLVLRFVDNNKEPNRGCRRLLYLLGFVYQFFLCAARIDHSSSGGRIPSMSEIGACAIAQIKRTHFDANVNCFGQLLRGYLTVREALLSIVVYEETILHINTFPYTTDVFMCLLRYFASLNLSLPRLIIIINYKILTILPKIFDKRPNRLIDFSSVSQHEILLNNFPIQISLSL